MAILAKVYWRRRQQGYGIAEAPAAFLAPVVLSGLLLCSAANLLLNWSFGFAVAFPLLGIGFSLSGFGLAIASRLPERWSLTLANLLLLIMSFCSIIAPN
jgi:hypothetical protein